MKIDKKWGKMLPKEIWQAGEIYDYNENPLKKSSSLDELCEQLRIKMCEAGEKEKYKQDDV